MYRSKDVSALAAACVLALGALLAGCARHDPTSAAVARARVSIAAASDASDRTSPVYDRPKTVAADLPVIVITGHRQLVLSERNSGSWD